MKWNTGAWFGSQLGVSAWLLGSFFQSLSEYFNLALLSLSCFLAINIIGCILFSFKKNISFYRAINLFILSSFLFTTLYMIALHQAYSIESLKYYLYLLLFPFLLIQFYLINKSNRKGFA
jgi:uncharacterized membrane protein YczE